MKVFAISDLHLSLRDGVLAKPMDRFGAAWVNHHRTIEADWRQRVGEDDVVLVAGDVSWASRAEDAREDLAWLGNLPGRKILVGGNHDWWLSSRKKARETLPDSVSLVHNDCIVIGEILVFGSRLWVMPDLAFPVDDADPETGEPEPRDVELDAKILCREVERLKLSMAAAARASEGRPNCRRICITHFPPTDFRGCSTEVTNLLASFGTDSCVFGHVHGLEDVGNGVVVDGVRYYLTSCDYLGFRLLPIPC